MSENFDDLTVQKDPMWNTHENILCLKIKFFAQSARIYGIVMILLDENEFYINDVLVNLSTFSLNYNKVNRESSFRQFYDTITDNTKEMLHSQKKNYFRIKNTIEKKFNPAEKLKKLRTIPKESISIFEEDLKELLRYCTSDKKIIILGSFEKVPKEDITHLQYDLKQKQDFEIQQKIELEKKYFDKTIEEEEDNDPKHPKHLKKCTPIVSPVAGVALSDLKAGDYILVIYRNEKIKEEDPTKNDCEIQKAMVVKKEIKEEVYLITVKINDLSYGILEEPENIKIKTVFRDEKIQKPSLKTHLKKLVLLTYFLGRIVMFVLIFIAAISIVHYLFNSSFGFINFLFS